MTTVRFDIGKENPTPCYAWCPPTGLLSLRIGKLAVWQILLLFYFSNSALPHTKTSLLLHEICMHDGRTVIHLHAAPTEKGRGLSLLRGILSRGQKMLSSPDYSRLKGLLFISGLRGLMGSANRSSSVFSSPPGPRACGNWLPTMASSEATPPLPASLGKGRLSDGRSGPGTAGAVFVAAGRWCMSVTLAREIMFPHLFLALTFFSSFFWLLSFGICNTDVP